MRAVVFAVVPALLTACTTVPRGPALTLAENGQAVANRGQSTVVDFATAVDGAVEFQLVDKAVSEGALQLPNELPNAQLLESGQRLSDLVRLRGRALGALSDAYGALAEEAKYDAPAALGDAVGKLTDSATAFASAAGVAGPVVAVASGVIKSLATEAAASAQKRRLIAASHQIAAATRLIADAIDKEAEIYAKVAASLGTDRQQFVQTLLDKGLADPAPTVQDFVTRQGLQPLQPPAALAVPVAGTILLIGDWRAARAAQDLYAAQVRALRALAAQHEAFETAQPMRFEAVRLALAELAGWAKLYADARNSAKEIKP